MLNLINPPAKGMNTMTTQLQEINTPATQETFTTSVEFLKIINGYRAEDGVNPMRHADFMRAIRDELGESTERNSASSYTDSSGKSNPCYNLTERQCMRLAMRESINVREKVADYLMDNKPTPPAPMSQLQMIAQMALEQDEANKRLAIVESQQVALESKVNSKLAELDNRLEQKLPHYRQKPSNGVTIGKIRKAMNSRYGLSQRVVDAVMFDIVCPKPVGTCDNNYNNGTSTLDVWSKAEISDVFRVFAGECQRVSSSRFEHPEVPFKFGMRN